MKRSMIAVIGLAVVVGMASLALAAPTIYELTPLTGYTGINVSAINDTGAAVGYCTNNSGGVMAFIWTSSGGMQALTNGSGYYARDINNAGQIVGDSSSGSSIYWASSGSAAQAISGAYTISGMAHSINNSGLVAGRSGYFGSPATRKAYVWNSTTNAITFVTGVDEFQAINDSGVAVGNQRSLYDSTSAELTTIVNAGHTDTFGTVRAVNNAGVAVGRMGGGATPTNAFIRAADGTITQLGTFGGYGAGTITPMGINELGQVVGDGNYGGKAFLWEGGTMTDLNTVLGDSSWVLMYANDINESGWIVGQATYNGTAVGYVMTPEPATLALMALGGIGTLLRRRRNK